MPFKKGNQWAKLKKGTKSRKVKEWEYMGAKIIGEATEGYIDLLERLYAGEELEKSELEAMNRYEKVLEYFKPKLARTELVGDKDKPLEIKVTNYGDNPTLPVQTPKLPATDVQSDGQRNTKDS